MIKGIHHKGFHVVDMEETLAFYCDKLGFKKAFEIHDDEDKPWIVYVKVAEDSFLEFFYDGPNEEKSQVDHICFEVENIDKEAERMRSKGIPFAAELSKGKDNNYQFWIKDPDGNWLEFMEMQPDSPQAQS
ncbi:VOC family protein [Alkalibacterium sp.]|nr:MAG: VOC family protein [Alkalibacterium sp.]